MIDPASIGLTAIAEKSPASVGWAFAAGAVTSIGPCVAPRYVAVAALIHGAPRPALSTATFVGGLLCAYVLVGYVAGLLGSLSILSSAIYALLATSLCVGGIVTLVRATPEVPPHPCPRGGTTLRGSLGGTFLLGAASAFVISPCCTPVLASVALIATASGQAHYGALLLASFSVGHALPLFLTGAVGTFVRDRFGNLGSRQAPAIVAGTLMLALSIYYGLLV